MPLDGWGARMRDLKGQKMNLFNYRTRITLEYYTTCGRRKEHLLYENKMAGKENPVEATTIVRNFVLLLVKHV